MLSDLDGEDIQKWLVRNGWALAYARFSRDYEADEKAARCEDVRLRERSGRVKS